jgi:hypothetical protein
MDCGVKIMETSVVSQAARAFKGFVFILNILKIYITEISAHVA